jgi:ElaB/YqjD/DUF883 family membrane-anchored ribosome-binding protein
MESRLDNTTATASPEARTATTEKLVEEIKAMIQRAEEKAVDRAKAADKAIREHPYQTIGLAFGLGLLIGVLVRRR